MVDEAELFQVVYASRAKGLNDFLAGGILSLGADSDRLAKQLAGFRDGRWRQNIV